MEKAKVYYTDFRTRAFGDGLPAKLQKLMRKAGIENIDMDGKFVAIKLHFGELGNISYLRPNYARAVVDLVKSLGGKPFLTDCNTMYPGSRKNALEHLECAWQNGFTPLTVGCPILIGDGLKGTDDIEVPVVGGEYVKNAKIGRAIMDADVFISLTHFKGHETAGFGGTIKNIGMGCGSRAGKKEQHTNGQPTIHEELCRGCRRCMRECANNGLVFDEETKKMHIDGTNCVGCGRCIGACNFDAIEFENWAATKDLNCRMAEYTKAVIDGRPNFHISLVVDVSPSTSTGVEKDNAGSCVTGFIPCKAGSVVRIRPLAAPSSAGVGATAVVFYNAEKAMATASYIITSTAGTHFSNCAWEQESSDVYKVTFNSDIPSEYKYVRFTIPIADGASAYVTYDAEMPSA